MRVALARWVVMLLATTVWTASSARAAEIELYHPRHRTAEELAPLVAPALEPHGAAIADPGSGRIVLRGDAARLQDARELLEQLDTARPQYRIETRIAQRDTLRVRGIQLEGWIETGGIRIGRVRLSEPSSRIRVREYRATSDEGFATTLRVPEGEAGAIWTGTLVPVHLRRFDLEGHEIDVLESRLLHPVRTGVEVRPRGLADGRIDLEIAPVRSTPDPTGSGPIQWTHAVTRVQVRPGEWIVLARIDSDDTEGSWDLLSAILHQELTEDSVMLVRAFRIGSEEPDVLR